MVSTKGLLMSILIVMLVGLVWTSEAYTFYVGGRNGWVINPSENFNQWASRNRFQVNDTLIFKYKKGTDSVLMVTKEDYDKCNTVSPIKKMDDGDSTVKIDRSGPHYFISGNPGSCEKGQKVHLVVMSVRPARPTPYSPPPSTSQGSLAPQPSGSPASSPDQGASNSTIVPASSSSSSPSLSSSTKYSIALVSVSLLAAIWSM